MPRRLGLAFAAVLIAVAFAAGTLALASGDGDGTGEASSSAAPKTASPATTPVASTKHGGRGPHGGGMMRRAGKIVLGSLAKRLGVTPEKLQTAGHAVAEDQFAATAKTAGLTSAEVDALKACHAARTAGKTRKNERRAACDRTVIRPALKKLKATAAKTDLVAKKDELARAAATELGVTSEQVLDAVRAELAQRLKQGAALGFVPADVRKTALACFDTPATCDVKALKAAARKGHGGPRGFGHRR